MKKYFVYAVFLFVACTFSLTCHAEATQTQENTRQIKSREAIAAENAHLQDALSPLVKEDKKEEESASATSLTEETTDTEEKVISSDEEEIIYTTRTTPISISHEGIDDLGKRFAMRLKSELNQSSLFNLEEGRAKPKLSILISTVSEFQDRPAMGSAYALVWVFVHDANTLQYYLDQEIGIFTADDIDGLVAKIMDRADGFAVLYNYLF